MAKKYTFRRFLLTSPTKSYAKNWGFFLFPIVVPFAMITGCGRLSIEKCNTGKLLNVLNTYTASDWMGLISLLITLELVVLLGLYSAYYFIYKT